MHVLIAQYPVQFYTSLPSRPVHSGTKCPLSSIARYSFIVIQLSELGHHGENENTEALKYHLNDNLCNNSCQSLTFNWLLVLYISAVVEYRLITYLCSCMVPFNWLLVLNISAVVEYRLITYLCSCMVPFNWLLVLYISAVVEYRLITYLCSCMVPFNWLLVLNISAVVEYRLITYLCSCMVPFNWLLVLNISAVVE